MSDRSFRLAPSDIDQAFERNEFRVVFQPKVDLATQRMTGAEVFIRWQHPQYGLLPPGLFLDFVEAQGRMPDLTGYVFHAALDAARKWSAQGHDWSVSINVAPGTVTAPGFAKQLGQLIAEYRIEPERVIIEVPERAVAQEPELLGEALLSVRAEGVHVALDGGGIVPVDLSQFVPMPFTSIKVGGPASIRLAQRLGLKGKGAIAARLRYAYQYNLEAVAVGAEDAPTMEGLADVGFTAAQGIWIQKPLSLDELLAWDGTWTRGRVSMEPLVPATPKPAARAEAAKPAPAPTPAPVAEPVAAKTADEPLQKAVSKEDMKKALEAVRARRAQQGTLQAKPEQKAAPTLPSIEDLEDILEDEEASAPPPAAPVKRQGFGPQVTGEPCPPMQSLVQRKAAKGAKAEGEQPKLTRRGSAQDGVL
jgi:EAL domain-containing protein (putative c-di-GMP-specific phosphodiesterase class I)